MGRFDTEAAITFDQMTFYLAFVPDRGAVVADAQMLNPQELRIRFTGELGAFPISYELPHVAYWNGMQVDLAMMISSVTEGPVVRQVAYTFSLAAMS